MKKFLAALLSLVLAFSFCVPAFAEESSSEQPTFNMQELLDLVKRAQNGEEIPPAEVSAIVDQMLNTNPAFANVFASVLKSMAKEGEPNPIEALHKEGYISDSAYDVLIEAYEKAEVPETPDTPDVPDTPIAAAIDALLATDPEAAANIVKSLSRLEYEDIQKTFDSMKTKGYLSDSAYKTLSDEIKVQQSIAVSVSESIANSGETTTSPVDGVKNFFGNIVNTVMGLIGLGGNTNGGDTTTTTKKPSSNSNTTIPKTGDIALYSVAGVALVAGLALVLTKKKKDDK